MSPEKLKKLEDLRALASEQSSAEIRVERAKTELRDAELRLGWVHSAKHELRVALQGAIEGTINDRAYNQPPGESSAIVQWFTHG